MALTKPRAYQIYDIDYKQAVRVVSTSNITLAGGAPNSVDGVTLSLNDRVLVTGQTSGVQNGIYYVTTLGSGATGTWTRSNDTDVTGELLSGTIVMVTEGTTYADTQWKLTTNDPITIGVTALTFVQNYLANSISYGATAFAIGSSNANATISVAGTSNVAVFATTGEYVTGLISASGNITSAGNISGSYILGNGSQLTGLPATYANANVAAYLASGNDSSNIITTANVSGGNVLATTIVSGASHIGSIVSVSGNITGGNLNTGAQVVATGNITGGNILTGGLVSATGNVSGGNLNVTGNIVDSGALSIITGSNGNIVLAPNGTGIVTSSSALSATGNITSAANISGGNVLATTIVSGASHIGSIVSVSANVTGGNLLTGGLISATGNIIGNRIAVAAGTAAAPSVQFSNDTAADTGFYWISDGNIGVTTNGTLRVTFDNAGGVSATGNITGGNILTAGIASVTGTITTAGGTNSTGFAVGNGAVSNVGLGFFPTAGTRGDYAIRDYSNVTSSIYLDVGMGGTAAGDFKFRTTNSYTSLATINSSGVNTPFAVSATGIVYGLELTSTQSSGDEGGQLNLAKAATNTTLGGNVIVDIYQNKLRFFENGGTNRGAFIDLTSTGAAVSTNLLAGAVAGSNTYVQFNDNGGFGGNGQFVYDKVNNLVTAGAFAGNTNGTGQNFKVGDDAWIGDINGADTVGIKGQQNPANAYIVFGNSDSTGKLGRAGTGPLTYAGAFSATSNVTGGNLLTAGLISSTGNITSAANVAGGNILATTIVSGASHIGSIVSVSANVTGGNLLTAGLISAASHIGSVVSVSANITGGNILTGGIISATGNVSGGNVAAATAIFSLGTVGASGNISGGNVLATTIISGASHIGSIVSASGNVTGGNLITAGLVSTPTVTGTTVTVSATGGAITLSPSSNVSVSSKYINNLADPVQNQDAATKAYVDTVATTGIAYHTPVSVATTTTLASTTGGTITYAQPNGVANGVGATITTTGTFNLIDTVSVQTANTRILVKDEANGVTNGIYVWSNATVITRAVDADQYGVDSTDQLSINDYFFVQSGNVNKGSAYLTSAPSGTITFGTSNIQFAQFSSSQTYTANTSAGISLIGTVINAKVDNLTTAFDGSGNISVKTSAQLTTPNIGAATGTSLSVTANVTGGNLVTSGQVTATGNITSAANVAGGNLLATTFVSGASHIGSIVSVSGNINGGNINSAGIVSAVGNIIAGADLFVGPGALTAGFTTAPIIVGRDTSSTYTQLAIQNASGAGSADITTYANNGTEAQGWMDMGITGNAFTDTNYTITGSNDGYLFAQGNASFGGNLVLATGNTGTTRDIVFGFGFLAANEFLRLQRSTNTILPWANITANIGSSTRYINNLYAASHLGTVVSVAGNITSAANISGGNVLATTIVSGASHIGSVVSVSANVTGGNLLTSGLISAASYVGSVVSVSANVTGGNLLTAGLISATGNITSSGNISGTYILGNGSQLTGLPATYANANVAAYLASGTDSSNIITTANVTGGNITTTGQLVSSVATGTAPMVIASTTKVINLNVEQVDGYHADTANTVSTIAVRDAAANITAAKFNGTGVSVSGNITGGNILTGGQISTIGNIYTGTANAGYVYGNAYFMTGISAAISVTKIENGNSNVWVNSPGGDVTVTAGGVSNVAVFSTGSMTLQGAFGTPKTITANVVVAGNINAMLIGPLTFGNGVGLTVPSSSTVYVYSPAG